MRVCVCVSVCVCGGEEVRIMYQQLTKNTGSINSTTLSGGHWTTVIKHYKHLSE